MSEDVVSGSVSRNIGEVSTAEVVLRNRYRKWLKDPENKESIFLPMDMITIWLQRVGGKPIQVFTGYLDSVPYYQLYPGNCTLSATCTLKKIAYTWFDPGLRFFQNIVRDLGWQINPYTGEATNPTALTTTGGNDPTHKINDAGFAQLLYEFMIQICGWSPKNVYISDLPPTLPKKAAAMYKKINQGVDADLNQLERVMRQVMGISFLSSSTTTQGKVNKNIENITMAIKTKADQYNINLLTLVTAALVLTGYDPKFYYSAQEQPQTWGYGIFAQRPRVITLTGPNQTIQKTEDTIEGHPLKDLLNTDLATELFCRKLLSVDPIANPKTKIGDLLRRSNAGQADAIKEWIEKASGQTIPVGKFNSSLTQAQQWVKTFNTTSGTKNSIDVTNSPILTIKHLTWADNEITSLFNSRERVIYNQQYLNKINNELAPYYFYLKKLNGSFELSKRPPNLDGTMLLMSSSTIGLKGGVSAILSAFNALRGRSEPSLVISHIAGVGSPTSQFLVNGQSSGGTSQSQTIADSMPADSILIQAQPGSAYPSWDGQKLTPNQVVGTSKNPDPTAFNLNGLNFQDFAKLSLDAAFTGQFAFPVNYIESQFLTGEKALANDISCMDAITQFCASSMRTFMSLPNGKFLAFYPDYFGAHGRKAYWPMFDIEIINMGVQLNDQSLATHVYVIGDTMSFGNQDLEAFNYIASRGVATLTQAEILDSLVVPSNKQTFGANQKEGSWGRLKDAYAFLQHYGARPYKEEQPIIRNSFYEFLYAWQRFEQKWSQTFSTQVEFTFQPEVLAGGILYFPQHNLQMYVEQVTHSWDYTAGFQTNAVLSSPAAVQDNGLGVAGLPGFALAGSINSIGISS